MPQHKRKPGRPSGITKSKLTVTIDANLTRKARKAAAAKGVSFSALMQMAVSDLLESTTTKPA